MSERPNKRHQVLRINANDVELRRWLDQAIAGGGRVVAMTPRYLRNSDEQSEWVVVLEIPHNAE